MKKLSARLHGRTTKENPQPYCFEANKFQLLGTIPEDLRNRYVPYRPLISWIFHGEGIRGFLLQRGLHAQHRKIYCYDRSTKYGLVPPPLPISKIQAGDVQSELPWPQKDQLDSLDEFAASRRFLEMVHYDEKPTPDAFGGRLYTYVITLQGEWRFTETGPEFAIQFLSKHSMHSDGAEEIACAGEFFVRRRRGPGGMKLSDTVEQSQANGKMNEDKRADQNDQANETFKIECSREDSDNLSTRSSHEKSQRGNSLRISRKPAHATGRSRDPRNFVLIIDNDSGTYRPHSKTLPSLQSYLGQNLPGLKVKTMACDDEKLKKWKQEQKPRKKVARRITQPSSSESSSDEDDIGPCQS